MEIVINISKDHYRVLKAMAEGGVGLGYYHEAVLNGAILPEKHGRLIDADHLKDVTLLHNFHGNCKYIVPYSDRKGYRLRDREVSEAIINAPTIIEADKESEER